MGSASHISPVEELATFLSRSPTPAEIAAFRLSDVALARVRDLMDKNADGSLTPEEGRELDRLILLDDIIGLIQTHAAAPDPIEHGSGGRNGDILSGDRPGTPGA